MIVNQWVKNNSVRGLKAHRPIALKSHGLKLTSIPMLRHDQKQNTERATKPSRLDYLKPGKKEKPVSVQQDNSEFKPSIYVSLELQQDKRAYSPLTTIQQYKQWLYADYSVTNQTQNTFRSVSSSTKFVNQHTDVKQNLNAFHSNYSLQTTSTFFSQAFQNWQKSYQNTNQTVFAPKITFTKNWLVNQSAKKNEAQAELNQTAISKVHKVFEHKRHETHTKNTQIQHHQNRFLHMAEQLNETLTSHNSQSKTQFYNEALSIKKQTTTTYKNHRITFLNTEGYVVNPARVQSYVTHKVDISYRTPQVAVPPQQITAQQQQSAFSPAQVDINRLSENVMRQIDKKIKIEKQRHGLL